MRLDSIPTQIPLDKLPSEFDANVVNITEGKTAKDKPKLTVNVRLTDGSQVGLGYNVPKALTGKGQFDKLIVHLKALKINDTEELKGRTFHWVRESLEGSMQGNPRHYPVKEIVTKK